VHYVSTLKGKKVSPYFFVRSQALEMPLMKSFIESLDFHMKTHKTYLYEKLDYEHRTEMVFDCFWSSILLSPMPGINTKLLRHNYLALENCIGFTPPSNIAWAYLHQFEVDLALFELSDNIQIRAANPLETALFDQESISSKSRTTSQFIIETKHSKDFLDRVVSEDGTSIMDRLNPIVRDLFRDAVSIFRILSPSGVGITSVWYRLDFKGVLMETEQIPFPDLNPPVLCPMGEVVCSLTRNQVDLARKLWYRIKRARDNGEKHSKILRAIETYDVALCSSRIEDSIRDIYVVFETLFSAKGRNLDNMIATLVSDTEVEKRDFQAVLKDCRRIRDVSTHGSRMKSEVKLDTVLKVARIVSEVLAYSLASMEVSEGIEGLAKKAIDDDEFRVKIRKKFQKWSPKTKAE